MNNNNKNIEELFKEKFSGYQSKPSDAVWKAVSSKLPVNTLLNIKNLFILSGIISVVVIMTIVYTNIEKGKFAEFKNADVISTEQVIAIENTQTKIRKTIENKAEIKYENNSKTDIITIEKEREEQENRYEKSVESEKTETELPAHKNTVLNISDDKNTKMPTAKFTASVTEGCAPLKVSFSNLSKNAQAYSWIFYKGYSSGKKDPTVIFTEPGSYTVSLVCTNNGLTQKTEQIVKVNSKPKANFIVSEPSNIYAGEPVKFANMTEDSHSCTWAFGDGSYSYSSDPIHEYIRKGIYDVKLFVESKHGCVDTASLNNLIVKNSESHIVLPDAFTPDMSGASDGRWYENDQSNDVFHPFSSVDVEEYRLRIFSKKGVIVFESYDIQIGWNGYYNGRIMPAGVYVYQCNGKFANGEYFQKTGDLTLIHTEF